VKKLMKHTNFNKDIDI